MTDVQLALSNDFLAQYDRMPLKVRKKIQDFMDKFRRDPKAASIHLEPISSFADPRARTARIGDDYRAIVVAPKSGSTYLLVHIDHHDEAMRWAANKRFDVHPIIGSLQVFDTVAAEQAIESPAAPSTANETGATFMHLSNDDLMQLGVPAPLLPSVRRVSDEHSFRSLAPHLPDECRESLEWILLGGSFDEARELLTKDREPAVTDIDDFDAALTQLDSQRRFVTVRATDSLSEILEGSLMSWRLFLHPDQRRLVEPKKAYNGPVRVLGGAGTGKTVVAMHRARYLADRVFTGPTDRILLTAYSKSLALSIRENLRMLCGGQEHPRIDVTHIDSVAARLCAKHGQKPNVISDENARRLWDKVLGETGLSRFDRQFVKSEWSEVVLAGDVTSEAAYLRVPRRGRSGPRLSKDDRLFLWSVFDRYRQVLTGQGECEWPDVSRQAIKLLDVDDSKPYRAVIVDEAQDFSAAHLCLVRALAPVASDDLFLVGDPHQRIFENAAVLSRCGIDIKGRGKRLRINYRTTHEIRQFAVAVLQGVDVDDLDGGDDNLKGYSSVLSGPAPTRCWFNDKKAEAEAVVDAIIRLGSLEKSTASICIVVPLKYLLKEYAAILDTAGIGTVVIGDNEQGDDRPGVRLCTMHRAKGLEFKHVLIASLGDERFPRPPDDDIATDGVALKRHDDQQRRLLYVAATRARDTLWVSGYGRRPGYL